MSEASEETTLGIVCYENIQGLTLALTSVLTALECPRTCFIYLTGSIPQMTNFYLEQLAALARFKGVEFIVSVGKNVNIRESRDYLLEKCSTRYLWMLDDDVIVENYCFNVLSRAFDNWYNTPVAYMNGVKGDVTNRRGYKNFELEEQSKVKDFGSFNHFYERTSYLFQSFRCNTMDTGNVLIDREQIGDVRFSVFPDSTNCGGEDALFGLLLKKNGKEGRFCPNARSYHLEKEKIRFDEFSARGEALLRACDLLDLDKEAAKKEMMPWLWK